MPRQSITQMTFARVYPMLVQKAERKGRTREEVDQVTSWLTGYAKEELESFLGSELSYGEFFEKAPAYHPKAELITGKICGVQVELIEDPVIKRIRQLDKLVDELAKGRPMEKVMRE